MYVEVGDDMNTLSKREKVLLYVLLCLIIVVGGVFMMVLPAMQRHNELSSDHASAEMSLQQAKASIIDYGSLDKDIKKATSELTKVKKKFFTTMAKEDVDALITQMAIEHNLVPESLNINDTESENVVDYKEYLKLLESGKTPTKAEENSTNVMKVYNVSLSVTGSIADVQTLVNDANKTQTLKIASVSYSEQREEQKTIAVTFKIYMI